jgi:TolB protein
MIRLTMAGLVLALVISGAGLALAQYDYIDIRNPSLRKIPLAISTFRTAPNPGAPIAAEAPDRLGGYLDFTRFFKILDRAGHRTGPDGPPTTLDTVNFPDWNAIGAELLITGGLRLDGDLVEMELRLFDTVKGELLVGKRYKGWMSDRERILRRFAGEVVHHLTGSWGVFDTQIAFVSNGTGHKEVYRCDFDGSNIRRVTRHNSITLTPAWSSDGKWLAYTSYANDNPDLYIKPLGGGSGSIVGRKGINTTPAWRPDRPELAATLSFTGDQDIYLLTDQGKVVRKLTQKWGIDTSPAWSPDGNRIAFVSSRSGSPQIHILTVASGQVERLTFQGRYNTQPSWSPAGDRIAYSAIEDGEINIHTIDLETRNPSRLTYNAGRNESPAWSPDGSLIVFSSTREGGVPRLYVMTAFGTDQRKLLDMPGAQTSPSWSPRLNAP